MSLEAFGQSEALTLGVELELQLVNTHDYNLTHYADDMLRLMAKRDLPGSVVPEMTAGMIEISTDVCHTWREAQGQLQQIRDALGLTPGSAVEFGVNREGQVVLHKAASAKGKAAAKPGKAQARSQDKDEAPARTAKTAKGQRASQGRDDGAASAKAKPAKGADKAQQTKPAAKPRKK